MILLDAPLEDAWRQHFHSPEEAVRAVQRWRADAGNRSPEDQAFANIIEVAGLIRTEPPDAVGALVTRSAAALQQLAPSRIAKRLAGLQAAMNAALCWRRRESEQALAAFEEALSQREHLEPGDAHYIRHWRAITLLGLGKPQLAFPDSLGAREYFRTRDAAAFALLSFNVGVMLVHAGDWDAAEEALRDAFAKAALVKVPAFQAMARSNLAYCLINTDRVDEARREIAQALNDDREGFLRLKPGDVLTTIAENLVATGYLAEAKEYLDQSVADARQRQFLLGIGTGVWNQGRLAALAGQPRQAAACYREALRLLRQHPQQTQWSKTALAVSELYRGLGDYRRALRWHRRFYRMVLRWQAATRDIRLAYAQAQIEIDTVRSQRDAAEAERARLALAMRDLESLNLELQLRVEQVETLRAELHEQAIRDPLTGLLNRRGLLSALQRMIDDSQRAGLYACVAMLDLDRFKRVNDEYGHALGDRLLAAAGHTLLDCFRKTDIAFRFGGDEFCVLLPGADREVGEARMRNFAERFAVAVGKVSAHLPFQVTASIGLAIYPNDGEDAQDLLDVADAALYRIKQARAPLT